MSTTVCFWDCNCEEAYVHSKMETNCRICGARRDDESSPDSRITEVYERYADGIFANDLCKGMIVAERDGTLSTITSNKVGIYRDIERKMFFGPGMEHGTMYIHHMKFAYLPEDKIHIHPLVVRLSPSQQKQSTNIKRYGF